MSSLRLSLKSDFLGALSSGVCILHCVVTPLIFAAGISAEHHAHGHTPMWWNAIELTFLAVTLFAVYTSCKQCGKAWLRYAFSGVWLALSLLIANEHFGFIEIAELWKYGAASCLIALHLYNLKYCR